MPCSSTHCPGRPPHTLPQSAGRACAGRVPCWLWVACASWLMQVACTPAPCPGCFTLHCDCAIVLGSSHHGFVGGSFPCLAHHSFPQCASGATAVANWVLDPWAQANSGAVPQGPQGWFPGCLIPRVHWWFHRTHQGPQWWPTGCWVPWAHADTDFALQGPQSWPSGCRIPCRRTHPFT